MPNNVTVKVNAQTFRSMENRFNDQFEKIDKSLQTLSGVINQLDQRVLKMENSISLIKQMFSRRGWLYIDKDENGNNVLKDIMLKSDKKNDIPIYGVDGIVKPKNC